MSSTHKDVEALFAEALKLDPAERPAFVASACGVDEVLRAQLEALLRAEAEAEGFLREAPLGAETIVVELTEKSGDRIGRYKLLQQIGQGGMGVVYMAEQEEPVRRRVALKIIKLGMDTRQVIARFEAERQALALMDHPNIALVLDGGATETGRPYFVMELVQGVPITEFCDRNKLSARERLKLFIQVCQAIQSAHQKGIIHRDIKPSNVLVTLHHGEPMPKVIDFGIAKATNQKLTEKTLFTSYATMMGTPAYMSPEQAEMSSLHVDTRTDVYALGVLLYELLTGTTPFPEKRLRSMAYGEMQRVIIEEEPERPSTRLSTMADELKSVVAKNRGEELASLDRVLRGDLDWVVMKCLEKDRRRRYETANGLATDIQRHLNSEPVVARPPSAAYRFQKLVRRNRLAFAAGAAVVAVLVLGVVVSTWQAWEATRARNEARANELKALDAERMEGEARRLAQAEAGRAEENEVLLKIQRAEDLFAAGDSSTALAYLAQVLRQAPTNRVASQRVMAALTQRNFSLPAVAPLQHDGELRFAEFNPDGQRIVTASADNTARVWDARTGQPVLPPLPHGGRVLSARFSTDGGRIVTASADNTARIWDARTGQPLTGPLPHNYPVDSARFSPDGRKLVTVAGYDPVFVWDSVTGQQEHVLSVENGPNAASFSADSQRVLTAACDGTARIWDANTGQEIVQVKHGYFVNSAQLSPDGTRLVTGSMDNTARVWDARTGQPVTGPLQHEAWVVDAVFSPDGHRVVTHSKDNLARMWDAETGQPLTLPFQYQPGIPSFTASTFIRRHPVQFTPNGQGILVVNWDNTARLWNPAAGNPLAEPMRHVQEVVSAELSADGQRVVTASLDRSAQVWDVRFGAMLAVPLEHNQEVTSAEFSPDGQRVVTASEDRTAWIWEVRTAFPLVGPFRHDDFILGVQMSDDGQQVATASYDHTARVWDAHTGQPLTGLLWHDHVVRSVQFSKDGRRLLTASDDGTARIWEVPSGKQLTGPMRHATNVVSARFSSDGQRVVTAPVIFTQSHESQAFHRA